MKLVRYGEVGSERPGCIDAKGTIRDLSEHVSDFDGKALSPSSLKALEAVDLTRCPEVSGNVRFGAPVANVGTFICVGLNYSDHAEESGMAVPSQPVLFMKAVSCIQGPNDDVVMPRGSVKSDWEVELGIVIGTEASYVDQADALDHVAGYVLVNDLSEREFQLEHEGQWVKGKGCPTFGPIGPWVATKDEIPDVNDLNMYLDVNGQRFQTGNTKTMIFRVDYIVSYISQYMKLMPGDIISTGTPPGVGLGQTPPVYLRVGDKMELSISGLGTQNSVVVNSV